jgi:myo-inositol-1(or 4)-monophosphatase
MAHEPAISSELAELAAAAAEAVGDQLRAAFCNAGLVQTKRDFHDVVTEYDRRSEETIREFLLGRMPESSVVGEEYGAGDDAEVVWYVDPIDGTNNFVSGIPFFCVSIGATWRGQLVAGAIYEPVRSELFVANAEGTFCNGLRLSSRRAAGEDQATLVTSFPTHREWVYAPDPTPDVERFGEMVRRFRSVRRLGSAALTLAYVAAARVDVAFISSCSPWDVAAGIALVRAAEGCCIPVPATAEHLERPWLAPGCLAHVGGFDLAGSCMAPIARAELRR